MFLYLEISSLYKNLAFPICLLMDSFIVYWYSTQIIWFIPIIYLKSTQKCPDQDKFWDQYCLQQLKRELAFPQTFYTQELLLLKQTSAGPRKRMTDNNKP